MMTATDNISQGEITVEAEPQSLLSIPARPFTGRSAYSYEVKRKKNDAGEEVSIVREVPESSLEQWLFGQLSILANRIMNTNRYKAVSVDEQTGEVSEPVWDTLEAQTLAQRLVEAVPEHVVMEDWEWGTWKRRNPNAVGRSHLHDMTQRIATARRQTWDAEYMDKVRARASRNGKKSKRPKDVTAFQVLGFPFADHATPQAKRIIAAALGKTTRTVERRLKDYGEGPSAWVPTSGSRYPSRPSEEPPASPSRNLSRTPRIALDDFMEMVQSSPKSEDWSYLLEVQQPVAVERPMRKHAPRPLDTRTTEEIESSFWALLSEHKMALGMVKPVDEEMTDFADALFDVGGRM